MRSVASEFEDIYLALIHHPVYNKHGKKITTTVTNLDLHDISRAARTYHISRYFVVNSVESQQALVRRMRDYWTSGRGAEYNQTRHEAFNVLDIADSLEEVKKKIAEETGKSPVTITTSAREEAGGEKISFPALRDRLRENKNPHLILLGTGWGLTEETIADCDYLLEPVRGPGEFNHLSVRTAAAIILDRLLAGEWWHSQ